MNYLIFHSVYKKCIFKFFSILISLMKDYTMYGEFEEFQLYFLSEDVYYIILRFYERTSSICVFEVITKQGTTSSKITILHSSSGIFIQNRTSNYHVRYRSVTQHLSGYIKQVALPS